MYFCLTGGPPYPGGTLAQKLIWAQTRTPRPISTFRTDVPRSVAAVINKMMAKDRTKRFPNAVETAAALAELPAGDEATEAAAREATVWGRLAGWLGRRG